MIKKITGFAAAFTLAAGIGAGAAAYTLADHAETLKTTYAHNFDGFLANLDEQLGKDREKLEKAEQDRMEAETRAHLEKVLNDKKDQLEAEQAAQIRAETDQYIKEINSFINQLAEEK